MRLQSNQRATVVATMLAVSMSTGCYNHHLINLDNLAHLQEGANGVQKVYTRQCLVRLVEKGGPEDVESKYVRDGDGNVLTDGVPDGKARIEDCEQIQVDEGNKIAIRTNDGSAFEVNAYNFVLTDTQLIAPDKDLLLYRKSIESADVKQMSFGKSLALAGTALAGTAAAVVFIIASAPQSEGFGRK